MPREREYLANVPHDVQDTIYEGRKIEAIKMVRGAEGIDLKAAKDRVEAIEKQLRGKCPEAFTGMGRGGCLGTIMVLLGLGVLLLGR